MTETYTEIDFIVLLVFSMAMWLMGFVAGRISND